jgi:hypothetical protein
MDFRNWLENSGPPGGLAPPKQDPTKVGGTSAFASYCGPEEADPTNPNGQLPPVKKRMKKMKKN